MISRRVWPKRTTDLIDGMPGDPPGMIEWIGEVPIDRLEETWPLVVLAAVVDDRMSGRDLRLVLLNDGEGGFKCEECIEAQDRDDDAPHPDAAKNPPPDDWLDNPNAVAGCLNCGTLTSCAGARGQPLCRDCGGIDDELPKPGEPA